MKRIFCMFLSFLGIIGLSTSLSSADEGRHDHFNVGGKIYHTHTELDRFGNISHYDHSEIHSSRVSNQSNKISSQHFFDNSVVHNDFHNSYDYIGNSINRRNPNYTGRDSYHRDTSYVSSTNSFHGDRFFRDDFHFNNSNSRFDQLDRERRIREQNRVVDSINRRENERQREIQRRDFLRREDDVRFDQLDRERRIREQNRIIDNINRRENERKREAQRRELIEKGNSLRLERIQREREIREDNKVVDTINRFNNDLNREKERREFANREQLFRLDQFERERKIIEENKRIDALFDDRFDHDSHNRNNSLSRDILLRKQQLQKERDIDARNRFVDNIEGRNFRILPAGSSSSSHKKHFFNF